jgi:hypothetical protein
MPRYTLKANRKLVITAYLAAVVVTVALVYYWYGVMSVPQPHLVLSYNALLGVESGFMENTLQYAINVNYFYCILPNQKKLEFSYSNQSNRLYAGNVLSANSELKIGANVPVFLTPDSYSAIPANCTGWKVSYTKAAGS